MKRIMRIFGLIIIAVVILVLIFFWLFLLISKGEIEPYKENGKVVENSIAEKAIIDINDHKNGYFLRGKNVNNPVLLLVSSGPGTPDFFFNEYYKGMNLEDYYTVCYWEYRGCCMVYDSTIDPKTITTSALVEDTKAMTKYLCQRFNKDKIYLMGFSGGSYIALQTVSKYPDLFKAYFGMAQVVTKNEENDTLIYNFMKDVFTKRNDQAKLAKLEQSIKHVTPTMVKTNDWMSFINLLHEAGGGTIKDKTEFNCIFVPLMLSKCYTIAEKFNYLKGLQLYRKSTLQEELEANDFRQTVKEVKIPVYFLSGAYDYNAPWPLVEEYCQMLNAPKKEFMKFPNSAHSPLWEEPEKTVEFLKNIAFELK